MGETAKHKQLTEFLRTGIAEGAYAPGERIPSENDLSRTLHVSRQTVRQAIGTLENEGLLTRVRGSGTFVRSQSTRRRITTHRIGVIITYLDDYVFPSIVQGIESVLSANGYALTLGITYNKVENERKALRQILETDVDGLIIEGTKSALPNPNRSLYEQLQREQMPFLFINGYYEKIGGGYVVMDDRQAGSAICRELVRNSHTEIGGIFKSDDMQGHKRYQGFVAEMNRNGLVVRDDHVIWYTTEDLPYLFGGDMAGVLLRRLESVTGVVCYNDQIAVRLRELLRRAGKTVPEDYSLVSVDNSPLASLPAYALTSFEYPAFAVGEQAAQGLLRLLRGQAQHIHTRLPGRLEVRGSVRAALADRPDPSKK